jgi:hypothetical protein
MVAHFTELDAPLLELVLEDVRVAKQVTQLRLARSCFLVGLDTVG